MELPKVICILIAQYAEEYIFDDWIDPDNLVLSLLNKNSRAGHYLDKNRNKLISPYWYSNPSLSHLIKKEVKKGLNRDEWESLSKNTSEEAIQILSKHPEKIYWFVLCQNKGALPIISKNLDKCFKDGGFSIYSNPVAIQYIEETYKQYSSRFSWHWLSSNPHDRALDILEKYHHLIYWSWFCTNKNPRAVSLISKRIKNGEMKTDDWYWLCQNENAISLIEENMRHLDSSCWRALSSNKNAIHIIKKYPQKYCWHNLSVNPKIFKSSEKDIFKVLYNNIF